MARSVGLGVVGVFMAFFDVFAPLLLVLVAVYARIIDLGVTVVVGPRKKALWGAIAFLGLWLGVGMPGWETPRRVSP